QAGEIIQILGGEINKFNYKIINFIIIINKIILHIKILIKDYIKLYKIFIFNYHIMVKIINIFNLIRINSFKIN
ncbi:hypothetical protein DF186_25595, partial [Enterococcus hirae]